MGIPVKLPVFEGPLDLLLHLIEKNKIDIYDIPIAQVTDQYLDYVRQMEREDLDVMSEFLVMAATLLDIKSRMLLPREKDEETGEEEGDPREELVRRLLEYKMYKYLSEELAVCREQAGVRCFRAQNLPKEVLSYQPPIDYEELLGNTDLKSLQKVFGEVLRRKKSRRDPIRSGFGKIQREEINIDAKTLYIRAYLQAHPRTDFRALLESRESREEVIVTFLILLELMKHQKIHIEQDGIGGAIYVVAGKLSEEAENKSIKLPETEAENEAPVLPETKEENEAAELPETDIENTLIKEDAEGAGGETEKAIPSAAKDAGSVFSTIQDNNRRDGTRALLLPRNVEVTAAPDEFSTRYPEDPAEESPVEEGSDGEAHIEEGLAVEDSTEEGPAGEDSTEEGSDGEDSTEEGSAPMEEGSAGEAHIGEGSLRFQGLRLRKKWRQAWMAHCLKAKYRRDWGRYWNEPELAIQNQWGRREKAFDTSESFRFVSASLRGPSPLGEGFIHPQGEGFILPDS